MGGSSVGREKGNYIPFSAIAGAGPILGPTMALLYG
jgi:carbon starvation protein CstA